METRICGRNACMKYAFLIENQKEKKEKNKKKTNFVYQYTQNGRKCKRKDVKSKYSFDIVKRAVTRRAYRTLKIIFLLHSIHSELKKSRAQKDEKRRKIEILRI